MNPALTPMRLGLLLIIGSNIALGLNPPLAKLVFLAGGSPETVFAARYAVGPIVLGFFLLVMKQRFDWSLLLNVPVWIIALGWLVTSICYLTSVFFIPVSLAVLIFFTFPLTVTLVDLFIGKTRMPVLTLVSVPLAFAGLALVLAPALGVLDWRGVVLAFIGAMGTATAILTTNHKAKNIDRLSLVTAVLLIGALIALPIPLFRDSLILPATTNGLIFLFGAAFLNAIALIMMFSAIKRIGSTQSALFMNLEPLITIGVALLFLGESLRLVQCIGVILVLLVLILESRTVK
jgi:drug/metabolite transporter (DMT)-like permease